MKSYLPIFRPKTAERQLMEHYGFGLNSFSNDSTVVIKPIIEIVDQGIDLEGWQGNFEQSFIEFPKYLNERSTRYDSDGLDTLMERYDASPTQYYLSHKSKIEIPVVSSPETHPPMYDAVLETHRDLREHFPQLAIRLFVTAGELSPKQKQNLNSLLDEARDSDILLLDVVDSANFDTYLYDTLQAILQQSGNRDVYLLNAFEPQDGQSHNLGPVLVNRLELDGFGDFVTDPRYPSGGGSSENKSAIIRQYNQGRFEVQEYKKETYPEAFRELQTDPEFDPEHCEFCLRMADEDRDWATKWKVYRMGHYIHTVLEETIPEIGVTPPKELDSVGETYIQEIVDDADET